MKNQFGPWATAIQTGSTLQLSTFWKRRMTMLAGVGRIPTALSRRAFLGLGTAALATCAIPTLRGAAETPAGSEADDDGNPGAGHIFVHLTLPPTDVNDPKSRFSGFVSIDPETGEFEKLTTGGGHSLRVSLDGRTLVYAGDNGTVTNNLQGTSPGKVFDHSGKLCWSPDGRQIVCSHGEVDQEEDNKPKPEKPVWKVETWQFSINGSDRKRLPIPDTDFVEDWSPDSKWFVTSSDRHPPYGSGYQLYLMRTDGTEQRRLTTEGLNVHARFSPDSKRIIYTYQRRGYTNLRMVNIDGTSQKEFTTDPNIGPHACWSPDGKRLAIVLHDWPVGPDGRQTLSDSSDGDYRVEVIDADGQNRRRLPLPKADFIGSLDWR